MTISSVQTLLPGRYAINATEKRTEKPPPKTYSVQEFPFKGYQPPQPDGFEQSRAHPDTSTIVIDNGKSFYRSRRRIETDSSLHRLPPCQSGLVF